MSVKPNWAEFMLKQLISIKGSLTFLNAVSQLLSPKKIVSSYDSTYSRAALLNRWAAKVLQVSRETFCHKLKIFLEKIMNYES